MLPRGEDGEEEQEMKIEEAVVYLLSTAGCGMSTETLAEQMGYDELNEEVSKYSEYFVTHFAR